MVSLKSLLSDVATTGRLNLTLTRYAHEVMAAAQCMWQQDAYEDCLIQETFSERPQPFEDWCVKTGENNPRFRHWSLVLELDWTSWKDIEKSC